MSERVYLTTTLPYVNDKPHLGHALEFVHADIFARYNRLIGNDVFFNTGTDEHGQKVYEKAQEEGKNTQDYVDVYAKRFEELGRRLDISEHHFIRTTDPKHKAAAQEFWKRCKEKGDIYKKLYKVKYCVGCELEKTDSELEDGKCPLHPNKELEIREEENYFFRFSNYGQTLLDLYKKNPDFVIPNHRFNEIKAFVERGLQDFSISRLKEKMPWGVEVPDDSEHVMYVWFDALVNYLSTIGWPRDEYKNWWPVIQFAGKDQIRQQAAMWQAMLTSAGIGSSKQIIIHGFINVDGQKMSKSLGNVIDPLELIDEYGTDAVRYYLARHIHPFEDSDFTNGKFHEVYTANLVNGLGNQAARIMKMAEDNLDGPVVLENKDTEITDTFKEYLIQYEMQKASDLIWEHIGKADTYIQETEPFKKIKSNDNAEKEAAKKDIEKLVKHLSLIAMHLVPFMPETAKKIQQAIKENKKPDVLFPRKEK